MVPAERKTTMMNHTTVNFINVYRDNNRWFADVHWSDGKLWRSWQSNFKTKARIMDAIRVVTNAPIRCI